MDVTLHLCVRGPRCFETSGTTSSRKQDTCTPRPLPFFPAWFETFSMQPQIVKNLPIYPLLNLFWHSSWFSNYRWRKLHFPSNRRETFTQRRSVTPHKMGILHYTARKLQNWQQSFYPYGIQTFWFHKEPRNFSTMCCWYYPTVV